MAGLGLSLRLSVSGPLSPASKTGGGGEGGGDAGPVGVGVQQGGGVGIGQDVARLGLGVSISRPLAVIPVVGIGVTIAIAIAVAIGGIAIIAPASGGGVVSVSVSLSLRLGVRAAFTESLRGAGHVGGGGPGVARNAGQVGAQAIVRQSVPVMAIRQPGVRLGLGSSQRRNRGHNLEDGMFNMFLRYIDPDCGLCDSPAVCTCCIGWMCVLRPLPTELVRAVVMAPTRSSRPFIPAQHAGPRRANLSHFPAADRPGWFRNLTNSAADGGTNICCS